MAKVHLQGNKGETRDPMAMCATQYNGAGKIVSNHRASYVNMRSEIVKLADFKNVPASLRCAHCCDLLLIRRNRQRKEKGLLPVKHYNEGWE
jgi:hypothetical protein